MYPVKRLLDAETENMRDQLAAEYTARTGVGQPVPPSPTARSLQWEPSDYYMKSGLADPALLDQVEEAVVETKTFVLCADKGQNQPGKQIIRQFRGAPDRPGSLWHPAGHILPNLLCPAETGAFCSVAFITLRAILVENGF